MLYRNKKDFLERFELYKETALFSLRNQKSKNFDIGIKCNPKHADIIKKEFPNIITFYQEGFGKRNKDGYYTDFVPWEKIRGLEKYDIQTSLDSDDMVSEDFIKIIEDNIKEKKHSVHIHFQPVLIDNVTNEIVRMKTRYSSKKGSAFYSLYQPEDYIFIGHDSHLKMPQYAKETILIDEGEVLIVIHDKNDSSNMNK